MICAREEVNENRKPSLVSMTRAAERAGGPGPGPEQHSSTFSQDCCVVVFCKSSLGAISAGVSAEEDSPDTPLFEVSWA